MRGDDTKRGMTPAVTPAKAGPRRADILVVQVAPHRIAVFDQRELPRAPPFLHALLSKDGGFHRVVEFGVDQAVHVVFPGEAVDLPSAVLPHPAHHIASHSDVERSVSLAGEDVDAGLFHGLEPQSSPGSPLSRG